MVSQIIQPRMNPYNRFFGTTKKINNSLSKNLINFFFLEVPKRIKFTLKVRRVCSFVSLIKKLTFFENDQIFSTRL